MIDVFDNTKNLHRGLLASAGIVYSKYSTVPYLHTNHRLPYYE